MEDDYYNVCDGLEGENRIEKKDNIERILNALKFLILANPT